MLELSKFVEPHGWNRPTPFQSSLDPYRIGQINALDRVQNTAAKFSHLYSVTCPGFRDE
jgi:hypothetical protein